MPVDECEGAIPALRAMVEHALALNQARMDYSAETLSRAQQVAEYSERLATATSQGILSKMAAHVRLKAGAEDL